MNKNFTFIHIGKSGGSTISALLKENNFNFNRIHIRRVKYNPDKKYLIVLRNPVSRFISAFYWRKRLVELKNISTSSELKFFQKYSSLDDLCCKLYTKEGDINSSIDAEIKKHHDGKKHPEHIAMDLDYYIGDFSKKCDPKNIIGVMCQETLNNDFSKIFGITPSIHLKNNKNSKPNVSEQTKSILKKYLHKDYAVIENLNNLNLLSDNQYKILLK